MKTGLSFVSMQLSFSDHPTWGMLLVDTCRISLSNS